MSEYARRLPTGTVTFLVTDIEGSTTLWEKLPAAPRHLRSTPLNMIVISWTARAQMNDRGVG